MRALAIVHQTDAGPGVFADEARERGWQLDEWLLSERGTGPPREIADYDAVMTFGGAMHADQEDRHPWLRFEKDFLEAMLDDGMPLLAVCLGTQVLADAAGGVVRRASEPEIGWFEVEVTDEGASDPVIGPLAPSWSSGCPRAAALRSSTGSAPRSCSAAPCTPTRRTATRGCAARRAC